MIIDNGSGYIKCGLASSGRPTHVLPSLIGKPKYLNCVFYQDEYSVFRKDQRRRTLRKKQVHVFGKQASESLGLYNLTRPIRRGNIASVEDLERFYEHLCFDQLQVDVSDVALLLTEKLNANVSTRQNIVQMVFEGLRVSAAGQRTQSVNSKSRELQISKQTSLALKSKGITSGVVVESGHGVSQVVPIFQDYIIENSTKELGHISGMEIDSQLEKYLSQSSVLDIRTDRDTDLFKEFKTKFGKVSCSAKGTKNQFRMQTPSSNHPNGGSLGRGFLLKVGLWFLILCEWR
jgi:actin-related protein